MQARFNSLMKQEEQQRNSEKEMHERLQEQYQYLRDSGATMATPENAAEA